MGCSVALRKSFWSQSCPHTLFMDKEKQVWLMIRSLNNSFGQERVIMVDYHSGDTLMDKGVNTDQIDIRVFLESNRTPPNDSRVIHSTNFPNPPASLKRVSTRRWAEEPKTTRKRIPPRSFNEWSTLKEISKLISPEVRLKYPTSRKIQFLIRIRNNSLRNYHRRLEQKNLFIDQLIKV